MPTDNIPHQRAPPFVLPLRCPLSISLVQVCLAVLSLFFRSCYFKPAIISTAGPSFIKPELPSDKRHSTRIALWPPSDNKCFTNCIDGHIEIQFPPHLLPTRRHPGLLEADGALNPCSLLFSLSLIFPLAFPFRDVKHLSDFFPVFHLLFRPSFQFFHLLPPPPLFSLPSIKAD